MSQSEQVPLPSAPESQSAFFSQRSRRQLGLFAAGAGFFALAQVITRRSIMGRYKASIPKFYQPSNRLNFEVNGAMEAFEALNIATINVLSAGVMFGGGLLWAFDVASLDDMRKKVRTNTGMNKFPGDQADEEQIEEWFKTILSRKEFKALRGGSEAENNSKDDGGQVGREEDVSQKKG